MSNLRVACTGFGTIKAGKVDKSGLGFTGTPQDVTSDCLKAVIEKIQIDHTSKLTPDGSELQMMVNVEGKPAYSLTLKVL